MSKRYNNYHKHTKYSSALVPDTHIDMESYFKRAVELGHTNYYTVEHGFAGSIFEAKELGEKYGINVYFGMEIYIVKNQEERKKRGYHCVVIAKTDEARKKMNALNSKAHEFGFYYNARWSLDDLLSLSKDDVVITTACCGGILKDDEAINEIFLPLLDKFQENIFIEIHNYNHKVQISHNIRAYSLSEEYGVKLIHANDSHYIYPDQHKDRSSYLKGKGISYDDEDAFLLDYPTYDEIVDRYRIQGVFSDEVVKESIENTLIFDNLEEVNIDKSIKMPSIYPDKTIDEKHEILKEIIDRNFEKTIIEDNINESDIHIYKEGIASEFKTIVDTAEIKSVDYFLLNEKVINLAKSDKYKGLLTKTGRGSNTAFYINKLLGFTEMDRFKMDLPLYPERFMSTTRLLETRSLPDNDYNTVCAKPFIDATREVLGENNCFYMIAYGTMQQADSFKNVCRDRGLKYDEFNEVSKNMEDYEEDEYWGEIIKDSKKFIGSIVSKSPSPCACLIMTENIKEEVGLIRIKDELVAVITSDEADEWKYLKNDYLQVAVWNIIYKTFDMIGIDPIPLRELISIVDGNEKVWEIYSKGLTATLNQADSDWATGLIKKYSPKSYKEFAMWTASIRPNFESFREDFINRKKYTHGVKELDELFEPTDMWILFQENLMQFFSWLGVPAEHTVGLIKKIGKKKISQKDFDKLESDLRINWIKHIGNDDLFDETWGKMQAMLGYGYNTPHGLAVTFDSLFGAYLKSHYPLEYYSVILNEYQGSSDKTAKITKELSNFEIIVKPVEFGKSSSEYSFDRENRIIYKGMKSVKYINDKIPHELNALDKEDMEFPELLSLIKSETSVNSRQLDVLIKIDYFKRFGSANKLLKYVEWSNKFSKKTFKIETVDSDMESYLRLGETVEPVLIEKNVKKENYELHMEIIKENPKSYKVKYIEDKYTFNYCDLSKTTYKNVNKEAILDIIWNELEDEETAFIDKAKWELEYVGYITSEIPKGITLAKAEMVSVRYRSVNLRSFRSNETKWFKILKELRLPSKGDIMLIHSIKRKVGYKGRKDLVVYSYEVL